MPVGFYRYLNRSASNLVCCGLIGQHSYPHLAIYSFVIAYAYRHINAHTHIVATRIKINTMSAVGLRAVASKTATRSTKPTIAKILRSFFIFKSFYRFR